MGVIKPPWIDKHWFHQTPFNFCDHFGDKKKLAEVCSICEEETIRFERYKKEGKDPYDFKNVFEELGENFSKTMKMLHEEAERMGIDLDNIDDDYEESPPPSRYLIYKIVYKYCDYAEATIKGLSEVSAGTDIDLALKAVDAFSHSRHYVIAKVARALSSRWHEKRDKHDELLDSKTSAFLAYVAVERNGRAAFALARHKPLKDARQKHLKFTKVSLEMAEVIKREFFPKDKLIYREFGCEDFDKIFQRV